MCDAAMTDSHPSTRTGREATQLTDTGSPNFTTTLEGDISSEQLSADTEGGVNQNHQYHKMLGCFQPNFGSNMD